MNVKKISAILIYLFTIPVFSQAQNSQNKENPENQQKWTQREVIIYRPQNKDSLNEVRCFLKVTDMYENDVTNSNTSANYAWFYSKKILLPYEKSFYLKGGMAMHLWLKEGEYFLEFYTPQSEQKIFAYSGNANLPQEKSDWKSNKYYLNTKNMPNVIFINPTANENGFFNGGWHIDYKAPKFYKYTKPYRN